MSFVDAIPVPDSYYSAPIRGATAYASQIWEQYIAVASIDWLHLRAEKHALERLASLGDDWDGNGSTAPHSRAIDKASRDIPALYQAVSTEATRWTSPHVTASESGEIVLEWWHGSRKVTLYISDTRSEYIKVGGLDIDTDMESGELSGAEDFAPVWAWLHA